MKGKHLSMNEIHTLKIEKINEIVKKVLDILLHSLKEKNRAGVKILDNGCDGARAAISDFLLRERLNVTGLEIYFDDLKEKKEKFKSFLNMSYVCGDAQYLPFKDNIFDRVLMIETLEHLKDAYRGLQEICRVLKKDGETIITTPNGLGLWSILTDKILVFLSGLYNKIKGEDKRESSPDFYRHKSLFSLSRLLRLIERNKLSINSICSVEGLGILRIIQAVLVKSKIYTLGRRNVIGESKLYDFFYNLEFKVTKFLPLAFHSGWIIACRKD